MIVDVGTGDGRAVLARAAEEPRAVVIGVDAAAASMSEASRRADRRGPRNVLFLAAGVETLPGSPLAGTADLVTVAFPWGSLLRGVLGLDQSALCGLASVARPGAHFELLVSVVPADGIAGIERLDASSRPAIEGAWASAGIKLISMREATSADVAATSSSWARRLGPDRPVWRLDGVRSG
ncbi:MAG TPA: class I SAM-dependent methyltransferase [Candidatus Limnocylindrales bacterium]|nr:class I SAM-dependent methyltransferase [Candidatus Limnocylindrales bacterium]